MFACLRVCLLPISSGTAGPIWLNFFCYLRLGHGMVLGQKNSGSGIRICYCQKAPPKHDRATKRNCQIGPAVPEEIGFKLTDKQTSYYFVVLIDWSYCLLCISERGA